MDNSNNGQQVVEVSLGWLEGVSLISGIASLVISGLAIWLSITFYKMSTVSSKEVKESSININNNVEKLEKMFDTMYRDTFGMVKDTVTHMRRQEYRIHQGMDYSKDIQRRIDDAISEHLNSVDPEKLNKKQINKLVTDLLKESKDFEVDVKKQIMKDSIISILDRDGSQTFNYLENYIIGRDTNFDERSLFFDVMHEMTQEGFVNAEFSHLPDGDLAVTTSKPIDLLKKK